MTDGDPLAAFGVAPIAPPPEEGAIPLDTGPQRPDMAQERWFSLRGMAAVRNVDRADLTPVLPAGNATGAAVVIAPGGGFLIGSMQNEGWAQACWLADRGVAAFVLKYRLEPTPACDGEFAQALVARFAAAADPAAHGSFSVPPYMIDDAAAALALVRSNAAIWSVDPDRIGYLGFSAGAMIGLDTVARATPDRIPAFLGAIYPSMAAREVRADAPPLFAAIAADDPLFGMQGYGLAESWQRAGRSVELHAYAAGGHGFGMGAPGTTSIGMMESFHAWLRWGGWLGTGEGRGND